MGVSGIVVSNHGARQLDYSPATISVLEEVPQESRLLDEISPFMAKKLWNYPYFMKLIKYTLVLCLYNGFRAWGIDLCLFYWHCNFKISLNTGIKQVVKAIPDAVPVLLDGGIRRGTDVFKALALGAKAVMVREKKKTKRKLSPYEHRKIVASNFHVAFFAR